ncbi:MAG: carbohydrate porin, partial [Planctomycetota bacterium]
VEQHYAVGLVQAGLGSFRPDDAVGLYVSFVDLSDAAGAGFEEDETVVEAFYRLQVTPAISVQPGLQFVINPSGDPDIDDALVGSLRASFTF